jgi:hypothetical protein
LLFKIQILPIFLAKSSILQQFGGENVIVKTYGS